MADSNIVTTNNINNSGTYIPTNSTSFPQFYNAFQQSLNKTRAWAMIQDSAIGNQLLSNLATLAVSCEYYTQRRLQEAFIDTAQSPISIYEGVYLLGGSIQGNVPSNAVVVATNSSLIPIVLDKYTTLSIGSGVFYLSEQITINARETVSFIAIEGNPQVTTVDSSNLPNQTYYVSSGYKCNNFVQVKTNAASASPPLSWSQVANLWLEGSIRTINPVSGDINSVPLPVYQSSLYPTGQVQIRFGDGVNGIIPEGSITITAYEVSGGTLNSTGIKDVTILTYYGSNTSSELEFLSMVTTTKGIFGGAPQPSIDIYKKNTSARFATNDRFVTAQDFQTGALDFQIGNLYPIKACKALGERDIYSGASALANVVTLVLVMYNEDYTQNFMDLFSTYMATKGVFCIISPVLAVPVTFNFFNLNITLNNSSLTRTEIKQNVMTVLQSLVASYKQSADDEVINIDNMNNSKLGKSWALSEFYARLIPVIGSGNTLVIDYSYQGINTDFTLEYLQYLYIDFANNYNINFF